MNTIELFGSKIKSAELRAIFEPLAAEVPEVGSYRFFVKLAAKATRLEGTVGGDNVETIILKEIADILAEVAGITEEEISGFIFDRMHVEVMLLESVEPYDSRIRDVAQAARLSKVVADFTAVQSLWMEKDWDLWCQSPDESVP